jgi:hypothetical protein
VHNKGNKFYTRLSIGLDDPTDFFFVSLSVSFFFFLLLLLLLLRMIDYLVYRVATAVHLRDLFISLYLKSLSPLELHEIGPELKVWSCEFCISVVHISPDYIAV